MIWNILSITQIVPILNLFVRRTVSFNQYRKCFFYPSIRLLQNPCQYIAFRILHWFPRGRSLWGILKTGLDYCSSYCWESSWTLLISSWNRNFWFKFRTYICCFLHKPYVSYMYIRTCFGLIHQIKLNTLRLIIPLKIIKIFLSEK